MTDGQVPPRSHADCFTRPDNCWLGEDNVCPMNPRRTPQEPYEAPPLEIFQQVTVQSRLAAVGKANSRTHLALCTQTLLIQHIANIRALRTACDQALEAVERVPTETLVRYAVRPDPEALEALPQLVDLTQFRAPTDLRGLEP